MTANSVNICVILGSVPNSKEVANTSKCIIRIPQLNPDLNFLNQTSHWNKRPKNFINAFFLLINVRLGSMSDTYDIDPNISVAMFNEYLKRVKNRNRLLCICIFYS